MGSAQNTVIGRWLIVGCSVLLVLACVIPLAFGVSGFFLVRRANQGSQAENNLPAGITSKTAALQDLHGWVEVQSETGDWSPAATDQLVTAGQHIRTGKLSSVSLLFMDGSQAILQAGSEIAIDELDAPAGGRSRTVVMTQLSGESRHQVVPNKDENSRYEVLTPAGSGVAKGTEFQVVVTALQAAYFYVTEGVVAVSAVETTVLVNPGFMTILYLSQPPLEPVQTVEVEGLVSQAGSQWLVAGTAFSADEETLIIGSPQVGDWVLVKGHLDESGQNIADWVILLRRSLTNRFSLSGTVEAIETGQWKINGQAIVVVETTELDENIQVGDTVYVTGLVETGGALQALQIERVDEEAGRPFTFTGIVQVIDGSLWEISGVPVETDEATELSDEIAAGDLVVVKGRIQDDGAWLAQEISLAGEDESDFQFTGELESKDPWKAAGLTFEIREDTLLDDDLAVGDLVRVEGTIDASGVWIATRVERIDVEAAAKMVLIGTVITVNPWVVNGITLTLAPDAVVVEGIKAGMLVRVELILQADGTWQVVRIEPVTSLVWFPGCMDVIATVAAVDGNQLSLLNWPAVTVADGATIEGTLAPGSVIRMRVCFNADMVIQVTYIVIIETVQEELPDSDGSGKVTVCHKPGGKKGGHSISISESALPAHLGHGDYVGSCR